MNKFTIGGVVAALVLSVLAITNQSTETVVERVVERQLGAVPTLTSPQEWNGVTHINERTRFRTASSTVVSYKVTATSTLSVICHQASGLSFAQEYEIAVGSTPNATSTLSLGKFYVGANGSATILASTTSYIFTPNTYVNVKMATSSGTSVSSALAPIGSCAFSGITI